MSTERQFANDCLAAINKYRFIHQVDQLSYSDEIEQVAKRWADQLAQGHLSEHNPNAIFQGKKMGENVANQWSSSRDEITGAQIAEQWYSEVKNYDFNAKHGRGTTGHFTQLVWKDSKEIGIGRSQAKDGAWIVVADFFPPGNFNNDYANNVFPPRDGKIPPLTNKDHKSTGPKQSARICSTSKQTKMSSVNGVTTTTTTETTKDEDGVEKVKVTEKVERPGAATMVRVNVTTTNPDGSTGNETWTEEEQGTPNKALTLSTNSKTPKDADFCREVVIVHNKFRQRHRDTEDLVLNDKLTALAQNWADHLAETKSLEHSKITYEGRPVGESIASKHGTGHVDYTGEEVVSQWYKEIEKYDYRNPPDLQSGTGTGHFTQVVWKDTKEIGVGKAFSRDNRVYIVALYYPAGNYVGRGNYERNVQPLKYN